MKRREFIGVLASAAVAWPLTAPAQQKAIPVIGVLSTGSPGPSSLFMGAFRQGLREAGYVEGQNLAIEYRWAEGNYDRLTALAADLVGRKVDVILASAGPAAQAAKTATASVPIVFVVTSPVEMGLVPSLGRPGGNITGLDFNSADLAGKRLELLRELVPTLTRVAVLWDRGNPNNPIQLEGAETAARRLGIQLEPVPVQRADDFDAGFKAMRGADGLLQLGSPLFTTHRARLVELATMNRLPAVYEIRETVEAGGLMSYGAHLQDQYRRAATYIDKILKGAKPADLPVEQPTKFELAINLKTAKALSLTVPPLLLARADEVIE